MNTTTNHGVPKLPQAQAQASQASGTSQGSAGTGSAVAVSGVAVDSKHVEKIRQAIADGSYQVNPSRIVDRMLAMDAQLAATSVADEG